VITIESLIRFMEEKRCENDPQAVIEVPESSRVNFEVETNVPTQHGVFRVRAYRDRSTGADHVAWISGEPKDDTLVRVHSECLTGEAFGSLKCECGPQLQAALDTIEEQGGVVIYLRGHEGRGIGLINKLKAYRLQEEGFDTLDANIALGLPADARDYGAAYAILKDLGVSSVRLLSNNPEKARQLRERGVTVTELVPLVVGVGEYNEGYLDAKRDRMGHQLPTHEVLDAQIDDALEAQGRSAR
jgi:3,4-dihydroxy 2-butanone 4-phosphate synthase/GTP cyclohydrolase II